MSFAFEEIGKTGPANLIAEHQLLVDWVKQHPTIGVLEYLSHRMIDADARAAFYYIAGLGMGDGQRFAIVHRRGIFVFDVYRDKRILAETACPQVIVSRISVPEDAELPRSELLQLVREALTAYIKHHEFLWLIGNEVPVSFASTQWIVRPRKHSRLYWRSRTTAWWNKQKPRAIRLRGIVTGPLAATLALLLSVALLMSKVDIPLWIVALSGIWLVLRLMQYDDDYVTGYWFIGVPKLRSPLLAFRKMSRMLKPRPLPELKVSIVVSDAERLACTIKVTNTTLFPIPYISISTHALADLLAPGFTESLRAKNGGGIDANDLRAYSRVTRRWMLPRQTVNWHLPLLETHPLGELKQQIEAIVSISRYVSGEPKSGPTSYLLPIVDTTISRPEVRTGE